jgi:sec-independent protein translocase protein TatC
MPVFVLVLVRLGILSAAKLRKNRRIGYFVMLVVAVLLPTVDPVSLAFEFIPLLVLFELSIQLAAVMERRWAKAGVLWAAEP